MPLGPTGLEIPRLEDIRQDMVDAIKASPQFGAAAQTGSGSRIGQIIDVVANEVSLVYELLQLIYSAFRPQTADGVHLDNLTQLAGVYREPAAPSIGEITPSGVGGTFIPSGSRVRVVDGPIFETTADGTIGSGDIPIQSQELGEIQALAGEIDTIVDAVAGWTGVTNAAAVSLGQDVESDAALRIRWLASFSIGGSCTDSSIAARVLQLEFVDACLVVSNRTDSTDAFGNPPHSGNPIVWPDTLTTAEENEILEVLFANWPTGIRCWGVDVIGTVTDSQGYSQEMRFDYANQLDIWVIVNVSPDATQYPVDGDDLCEAAVLEYGTTLSVGDDVLPPPIIALINEIPGIRDVEVLLGTSNPPIVEDPVITQINEIAIFDAARISVVHV